MGRVLIIVLLWMLSSAVAQAFFYRAQSMSAYCEEYLQLQNVEVVINEYNAGICAGYMASKLEFLQLTDRLCDSTPPNLDDVIRGFITFMQNNSQLNDKSSARAVVTYLDSTYTCDATKDAQ